MRSSTCLVLVGLGGLLIGATLIALASVLVGWGGTDHTSIDTLTAQMAVLLTQVPILDPACDESRTCMQGASTTINGSKFCHQVTEPAGTACTSVCHIDGAPTACTGTQTCASAAPTDCKGWCPLTGTSPITVSPSAECNVGQFAIYPFFHPNISGSSSSAFENWMFYSDFPGDCWGLGGCTYFGTQFQVYNLNATTDWYTASPMTSLECGDFLDMTAAEAACIKFIKIPLGTTTATSIFRSVWSYWVETPGSFGTYYFEGDLCIYQFYCGFWNTSALSDPAFLLAKRDLASTTEETLKATLLDHAVDHVVAHMEHNIKEVAQVIGPQLDAQIERLARRSVDRDTESLRPRRRDDDDNGARPLPWSLLLFALMLLLVAVGLPLAIVGFVQANTTPDAPVPPVACNYSEWSMWSIECFELPNFTLAQVRSQNADPYSTQCPQLVETQACDIYSVLRDVQQDYHYACIYDLETNLCNESQTVIFDTWYPTTNASDLEAYYATAPFSQGIIHLQFGIFPCLSQCPLTNTSAEPTLPCNYSAGWTAWSATCLEYPPGVYSVARTSSPWPAYTNCPDLYERQECYAASAINTSCASLYAIDTFGNLTCNYDPDTNLCGISGFTITATGWCRNNATNLTHFYEETQGYFISSIFQFQDPCDPLCPVTNGSIPFTPVPSDLSPPAACTYTAWGAWSPVCLEYPPGEFSQVRVRQPDPPYSYCLDTAERGDCDASIPTCDVWANASNAYVCFYDTDGVCSSTNRIVSTTNWCVTNASNFAEFFEETTSGTPSQVLTIGITPCLPDCPPTDPDYVVCTYSAWSDWSAQCLRFAQGDYRQQRTRTSEPFYALCYDTIEYMDCNGTLCGIMNISSVETICTFDSYTTRCVSSQLFTTYTTLCPTNTLDMNDYLASVDWPFVVVPTASVVPCAPTCPTTSGFAPAAPPVPGACSYAEWGLWSLQCTAGSGLACDYRQYRNKTQLNSEALNCPRFVQWRLCRYASPDCQTYVNANTTHECFYNEFNACANSTATTLNKYYCTTNATNIATYEACVVPVTNSTEITGIIPCDASCPPTNPNATAITFTFGQTLDLTGSFSCLPPFYPANPEMLNGTCIECTNTSVCTKGCYNVQLNTCVQVAKCDDGPVCGVATTPAYQCTVDTCNTLTGACTHTAKAYNLFNTSVQAVCEIETGIVRIIANVSLAVTIVADCDDGIVTTVDSYSEILQRCIHVTPDTDQPVLNISSCVATTYVPTNRVEVSIVIDDRYICDGTTRYCHNDECVPLGSAAPTVCSYAAVVNGQYQVIEDDSRCASVNYGVAGHTTRSCRAGCCPNSKTGCANCATYKQQLNVVYSVCDIQCACCGTNFDCLADHYCSVSKQCVAIV